MHSIGGRESCHVVYWILKHHAQSMINLDSYSRCFLAFTEITAVMGAAGESRRQLSVQFMVLESSRHAHQTSILGFANHASWPQQHSRFASMSTRLERS